MLSSVANQHLVSCVTVCVDIFNVRGCDLGTLFDSLEECRMLLWIECQRLGREETSAVVRAMESREEVMELYHVKLDIVALANISDWFMVPKNNALNIKYGNIW